MNIAAAKNPKYFIQNKTCPLAGKWALVAEQHLAFGTNLASTRTETFFEKMAMEQLVRWMKKSKPREVLRNLEQGNVGKQSVATCGQRFRQTEIHKVNLEDTTAHRSHSWSSFAKLTHQKT